MYAGFYEEGDLCPECKKAKLDWPATVNCSCHINPPCNACTNKVLTCMGCGWADSPPSHKDIPVCDGLVIREFRPKPLDKTKIDYRIQMHTASTQKCVGVYPEGTTMADVEARVKGTFGGRFEQFGSGRFVYVAYTD